MNDFVLIRKNLFRKKLRADLMLVSIIVAFAASSACSRRSNAPSTPASDAPPPTGW